MARSRCLFIPALAAALIFGAAACRPPADPAPRYAQIYVTTTPEDATLLHNGVAVGQTPATLRDVPPGDHLMVVRKPGFREARWTVTTQPNERHTVEIKLEPLTGLLLVLSEPPGAEIDVNGASMGKTPRSLYAVPLGEHRLTVRLPGYLPRVATISVADRIPQKIELTLTPDSARVPIESTPTGAVVKLDGATLGHTPYEAPAIATGEHVLEMSLPGHTPFRQTFSVQAGQTYPIKATLIPLPGKLTVRSVPEGARIYVKDQYKTNAPASFDLPAGTHVVRAEARGFDSQTVTSRVAIGAESVVEFGLVKSSGTLLISTEPPGVDVYLDGEPQGVSKGGARDAVSEQMTLEFVPQGQRTLQFTKPGYFDVTRALDIQPKQTLVHHEKMRPRPVPFVPTVVIRTGINPEDMFRGIIRERFENGNIYMEIEPGGIFKTFTPADIMTLELLTNAPSPQGP